LRILIALVALAGGAFFFACGGDDDATSTPTPASTTAAATTSASPVKTTAAATPTPTDTPAATGNTDIDVTLSEYSIVIDANSGPTGKFNFSIENTGPNEGFVLMIVQTDLAPDELPQTSTGQFAPNSDAVILANTPNINPDRTDSFEPELEAGNYVFICNNSDAEGQGHYGLGMRVGFTVE
jgi:hypothetical protein